MPNFGIITLTKYFLLSCITVIEVLSGETRLEQAVYSQAEGTNNLPNSTVCNFTMTPTMILHRSWHGRDVYKPPISGELLR